jgi:tape measure domain-containing protein
MAGRGLNYTAKVDIEAAKRRVEELKKSFKALHEETVKANKAAANASPSVKPITAYQQANLNLRKVLVDAQGESQRLRNEILALNKSLQEGRISAQAAAEADRKLRRGRRELAEATRAARLAQKAANGSYDEASARLKELGRSIKSAEGGFKSTSPVIKAQIKEYNELNNSLKSFDAQLGNHQRNVGNYPKGLNGVVDSLKGIALSYISVQAAMNLAMDSFNVTLKMDAITTSLAFTLRSTDAAKDKLEELRATANRLGLDFIPLAETYTSFAGAARAANFPAAETDKIFNALSGSAARLHLTSDQLSGALNAVQQMISKGTVQSEELRGQLGERLPGAFSIAARAMGKTEKELGELLKSGDVLASELLPKLADELNKTFSLDADTRMESLTASVNRLKTSYDNILQGDGIGKLFMRFVDGANNALVAMDRLMDSRSFGEFTKRLLWFDASDYDKKNAVTDNFKASQPLVKQFNPTGAAPSVVQSSLLDMPIEDLEKLRQTYLKATKQAEIAVNTYKKGVASGALTETGKISIKQAADNFTQLQEILSHVNTAYDKVSKNQKKVLGVSSKMDFELQSVKEINARILELRNDSLKNPANKAADDDRILKLKERLKIGSKEVVDAEVKARNDLQAKIQDNHAESLRRQESTDKQELDSVKAKYAAMRKEVTDFNNNPKNKIKGLRLGYSLINEDEKRDTANLKYKQDAKKQLESLDLQRKQYIEYEQFKSDFGAKMADKRFGADIAKNKNYLVKLQQEADKINAVPLDKRTNGQIDYLKDLNERIAEEKNAQAKRYSDLLLQLQTYQEKAEKLRRDYETGKGEIAKNPYNVSPEALAEQYKILYQNFKKQLGEISLTELTNSEDWENLFSNLDMVASDNIEKLIKAIRSKKKSLSAAFSPVDLAVIEQKLQEAQDVLIARNPFKAVGNAIKEVFKDGAGGAKKSAEQIKLDWNNLSKSTAAAFGFVNDAVQSTSVLKDALGDVAGTALQSLTSVATVAIAVKTAIKSAEKASVVLAVVSAALVVVQSIGSVLGSIFNAGDKRLEKKIKGYQDQLDALDRGFKQLERDVSNSVGESFYSNSLKEIENLKQQQRVLSQQLDAERAKKHTDEDKVNSYQDKLADIPNKIEDIQTSITEMLVQTTFKDLSASLSDAFTDAFANGENSLERLNEAFNKVIANAVKKGLELKFLQPAVDGFINDFADYMKSNGNGALGFDFEKYRNIIKEAGEKFSAGLTPFKDYLETPDSTKTTSSSALNNSIKGITSDQANALEGPIRGTYDNTKQLVGLGKERNALITVGNNLLANMHSVALSALFHQQQTSANTFNTVEELKKNNKYLADIVTNTKGTSLRGGGLGI